MTRRLTHALAAGYTGAAAWLGYCAHASWQHGSLPWVFGYAAIAVLLLTAVAHHAWQRDELRFLAARLERATRPADTRPDTEDGVVRIALAAACCERWWTSAGTNHDPDTCTRKDQPA